MIYKTHTLDNGIRIIFEPLESAVTYCGMIIDVGSRDEAESQWGAAHFIEHLLFKGTQRRTSRQIINAIENVGGELNAYTAKEETVVYSCVLNDYAERAIDVIGDVVLHSTFPENEVEKEREVILDEILSYKDSPAELIFDDFEEQIFGNNSLAHNILGTPKTLKKLSAENLRNFFTTQYQPEKMVFFIVGKLDFNKIIRWTEKYFRSENFYKKNNFRQKPNSYLPEIKEIKKKTHQIHCVLGNCAYNYQNSRNLTLILLNNILGGAGMNSLLNLQLREKYALVYQVESNYQPFTDCGLWSVYFACDSKDFTKCEKIIRRELQKLRDKTLNINNLTKYKRQLLGQLAIANETNETRALNLGKSLLRFGEVKSLEKIKTELDKITVEDLQLVANEIFNEKQISILKYI